MKRQPLSDKEMIAHLQGKIAVLKIENNGLRRALRKLKRLLADNVIWRVMVEVMQEERGRNG